MPGGVRATFGRQRFRQHEVAVESVGERQQRRPPEGQTQVVVSEPAAKSRTDDKAEAKGRANQAEGLGALFRGRDVGYIGKRGGDIGSGNSRYEASHKQPAQGWGDGHENVVEPDTQTGKQDDRAAAETVGPSS